MTHDAKSPLCRDKLKSAIRALAELVSEFPEKSRRELLRQVELKYDLSPLDSEFLERHFREEK